MMLPAPGSEPPIVLFRGAWVGEVPLDRMEMPSEEFPKGCMPVPSNPTKLPRITLLEEPPP